MTPLLNLKFQLDFSLYVTLGFQGFCTLFPITSTNVEKEWIFISESGRHFIFIFLILHLGNCPSSACIKFIYGLVKLRKPFCTLKLYFCRFCFCIRIKNLITEVHIFLHMLNGLCFEISFFRFITILHRLAVLKCSIGTF